MSASITVGITTRDRPASLVRCVTSLAAARHLIAEILVFDDASQTPASDVLPSELRRSVTVIRDVTAPGYIVGRNRLVEAASRPLVLLMDDDTKVLASDALERAVQVLACDRGVAAVAFAQAEEDGRPWDARMQPSPAATPRRVRSYTGFAHLIRRDIFRALGGYRELFRFYGEEKEFCLRLLNAGYSVVYLPEARIAHIPDPAGRDRQRYLRFVARNDCLNTLLNDPVARVAWTLPARLALYFRMRSGWHIEDPGGFRWVVAELLRARREILRQRRPVSRRALRRWRELGPEGEPYVERPVPVQAV